MVEINSVYAKPGSKQVLSLPFSQNLNLNTKLETPAMINTMFHLSNKIPIAMVKVKGLRQAWICRLPGARENMTVCGVAPVLASTRPGLNPSGLVNKSSLTVGPQFTEVKIL